MLIGLAFVAPVYGETYDDQWFVDMALTNVENSYGLINIQWVRTVNTGWHDHGVGPHKHVTLIGSYGYKNSGTVSWQGRVYDDGTIYSMEYNVVEPKTRKVSLKTTVVNPKNMYIWNGVQWVYNNPTIRHSNGRILVIYP